jgi:Arc/MetJ-type ribon-helix-helix transcriptional regulator
MEFIVTRDEKQRMVADELDPGPVRDVRHDVRPEGMYNGHKRYTKGIIMARFVVTIPDDFLAEVDARAEAEHRSRSELVREALRGYLRSGERKGNISDRPEVKRALRVQEETRRLLEGSGYSGSEAVRKMRDRIY